MGGAANQQVRAFRTVPGLRWTGRASGTLGSRPASAPRGANCLRGCFTTLRAGTRRKRATTTSTLNTGGRRRLSDRAACAARWTVSSRLGFIPNTHWQLGRTIDVPLGGTISRYASTGFYSGILHVLASALVTYFISINCDFKQHFRTASCYCSRGAQRVLRSGDMEYVMLMLHLIFSLPHAWGGTTCSVRCLRSLIPENSSGGSL